MVTSSLTKMEWWVWVLVAFLLLTIEFFATTAHIGFLAVGAFLVASFASVAFCVCLNTLVLSRLVDQGGSPESADPLIH